MSLECPDEFRQNAARLGCSPSFVVHLHGPTVCLLLESGYGCNVGGVYVEVVGYADDLLLLAPTWDAA